jgi:predicted xylose isomerase-like sugar epimerase
MKNKTKSKFDPIVELISAFEEDLNDTSLVENYNRFESELKVAKDNHNKLVPVINTNTNLIKELKESILTQALQGIISVDANKRFNKLTTQLEKDIAQIKGYRQEIDRLALLLDNYNDWSDRKFFGWWKAIKAVDPTTAPWLEWKQQYKGKII